MKKINNPKIIFRVLLYVLVIVFRFDGHAQTMHRINTEQVIQIIKRNHPLIKQFNIKIEQSENEILLARSNFDPVLNSLFSNKTLNNENYYSDFTTELKLPTLYGINIITGLETLNGNRIDASQTLGAVSYAGVEIPLLRNWLIDKRNALIQLQKYNVELSKNEQRKIINDLCNNGLNVYWKWVNAYEQSQLLKEIISVNNQRLNLVKKSVAFGERAAIDTIEAMSQLQYFEILLKQEQNNYINAGIELSFYLWNEEEKMYVIDSTTAPESKWSDMALIKNFQLNLNDLLNTSDRVHPDLVAFSPKFKQLEINKRIKYQDLMPKLDLKYNVLSKGYYSFNNINNYGGLNNNYKYGLKFEMPLRPSEARSNYKNAKLKIEELNLDFDIKTQMVKLKITQYYNELNTLKQQLEIQENNVSNFSKLLDAEDKRFEGGEGSIFLINARENKKLEALQKLIDLKTKYFKTIYNTQWSVGLLQ